MSRAKGPRILGIYAHRHCNEGDLNVVITAKQFNKLADWVKSHVHWVYSVDNDNHREVVIEAKDELQAMMRFNQLWAGLPKIGE